jgi:hypothetical protein
LPRLDRRAAHFERQQAGRVRDLFREVHLKVAEHFAARFTPALHRRKVGVFQQVTAERQGFIQCAVRFAIEYSNSHTAPPKSMRSDES